METRLDEFVVLALETRFPLYMGTRPESLCRGITLSCHGDWVDQNVSAWRLDYLPMETAWKLHSLFMETRLAALSIKTSIHGD